MTTQSLPTTQRVLTKSQRNARFAATLALITICLLGGLSLLPPRDSTATAFADNRSVPTPALAPRFLSGDQPLAAQPLDETALQPTAPAVAQSSDAPAAAAIEQQPAPSSEPAGAAPAVEQQQAIAAAPPTLPQTAPKLSTDARIPEGVQVLHQEPNNSYITVGDDPTRYYLDRSMNVIEVRLPGVDTAPNSGRSLDVVQRELDVAATAAPQPTRATQDVPALKNYCSRCGWGKARP